MKSIINRHTAALKKLIGISLVLAFGLVGFFPQTADARLIFTTEDDGVNSDAYHLDNDDSSADFIDLGFGTGLGSRLRYDIVGSQFLLNQDLNLEGNALEDFRVENSAAALACAVAGDKGRMYYDTTTDDLFFCDGTQWISTSANATALAGDGLVANGSALDVNVDDSTIEIAADIVQVKDGGITSAKILDGTIVTGDIATDTILAGNIATGAVTTDEILDETVTIDDLGTDSVGSDEILAGAVDTAELAADAVTTAKIAADTILAEDIATGAVTTDEILDGTITTADINLAGFTIGSGQITDGSVTVDDLGTGSVGSDEIIDGSITTTDMTAGANNTFLTTDGTGTVVWELKSSFMSSSLASGDMWVGDGGGTATAVAMSGDVTMDNAGVTTIGADKILTGMIATGAVELTDLATDSVNSAKIVDASIETDDLNASGAGNDKRLTTNGTGNMVWVDDSTLDNTLNSANIFVGNGSNEATGVAMSGDATINNAGVLTIGANKILTGMIAAGAVELSDLAGDSVNSAKIVNESILSEDIFDGTITAADLGTDSVGSDEILAGAVDTAELANDAVTSAKITTDTIIADDIATGAVTTDEIFDGTVGTVDLNASGVGNNKTLTTDGTGNMVWVDDAAVTREVSAHVSPEFSNFTLRADGTNNKGSLESDHDTTANKNFYKWKTRKTGTMHDYDVVFQWMVPDDFQSWTAAGPSIEVDFKTDTTVATDNKLDITMTDTAGAAATLAGTATGMVSTTADTWVEDQVVAAASLAGTYTPGEYVTITVKMSSKATTTANRNPVYLGAFNFNYVAK